ncbi:MULTISPECIES: DNA polymerase III subunit delta [unclassified Lactobacillus]|uniref:DNA polymerase III subunit delta n=1 Tax=unclassified Lactobacillus TaxID=2620435 RepID=UPI000EFC0F2B|nr:MULTISPECIES: DNA polymerase III subunit delta [unclassified Lactobacillus]RMC23945.1 DNA polymerase III subunit delta [Lactobacillus sp. ESL0247]RMC28316.1 DNA polymerase III subunit delta [Lactobacillus sp. ESL0246]RMC31042.1 DNA polymerase III subunit delta [Lactobacillus sp. ESL0245]
MEVDITNKDEQRAIFLKKATEQKKLAHSYLFFDINEQQALNTSYWLACLYNCTGKNKPDGTCRTCRQIISGNHPDVLLVTPENKQSLGIDQIRYLKDELAKSPVQSDTRFFFINEAEKLTLSASNALLNLLEEPIAPVVTILITNNSSQILPTIRSRTQIVNFSSDEHDLGLNERLLENGFSHDEISELGNTQALDQACKYFYQELLEHNSLAMISAHQLADMAKTNVQQNYLLFLLKEMAQNDLINNKQQVGARFLKYLLEVDKMRYSNVGFRNLLDYLALQ